MIFLLYKKQYDINNVIKHNDYIEITHGFWPEEGFYRGDYASSYWKTAGLGN